MMMYTLSGQTTLTKPDTLLQISASLSSKWTCFASEDELHGQEKRLKRTKRSTIKVSLDPTIKKREIKAPATSNILILRFSS